MEDQERLLAFSKLCAGLTQKEVYASMGEPNSRLEGVVPDQSGVGEQSAMWIKLRVGDPYCQWVYILQDRELVVWFAKDFDSWLIALRISVPSPLSFIS